MENLKLKKETSKTILFIDATFFFFFFNRVVKILHLYLNELHCREVTVASNNPVSLSHIRYTENDELLLDELIESLSPFCWGTQHSSGSIPHQSREFGWEQLWGAIVLCAAVGLLNHPPVLKSASRRRSDTSHGASEGCGVAVCLGSLCRAGALSGDQLTNQLPPRQQI